MEPKKEKKILNSNSRLIPHLSASIRRVDLQIQVTGVLDLFQTSKLRSPP
jgi:hypothetical protein